MVRNLAYRLVLATLLVTGVATLTAKQASASDPQWICLQHPVTGECGVSWIHNCWCSPI